MKKTYSYAELKGRLKKGMRVSAVPGKSNMCDQLKDDGSNEGVITRVEEDYFYINGCFHSINPNYFLSVDLELTWETLAKGGSVFDENGIEQKVIERLGEIVFLSDVEDPEFHWENRYSDTWTIDDLKVEGYTLSIPQESKEVVELSMDEVAEKFGKKVDEIRIKKD